MKKNTIVWIAVAGLLAFFYFKTRSTEPDKNKLASLVDNLDETDDYKNYFKSRIAEMTPEEVTGLITYLASGRSSNALTSGVTATYQKYLLGS